jgi:hypothetical protein
MESEELYQYKPIYQSEYAEGTKQIVFSGHREIHSGDEETQFATCVILDHNEYRIHNFEFKDPKLQVTYNLFYAFGLTINLFHTKMLAVDFDNKDINKDIIPIYEKLKKCKEVKAIDLLESSRINGNYHMILGFDRFYDVRGLPGFIPKSCIGHAIFCTNRREQTIRVSQKFMLNQYQDTSIIPLISWNQDLNQELRNFPSRPKKIINTPRKLNLRTS